MRAFGMTCGVGSMLIGARSAGFEVVGNVEWRDYYHTGTFQRNFPGAFMVRGMEALPALPTGIDLVLGHTDCGTYSRLQTTGQVAKDDPGDIPQFVQGIRRLVPLFFAMDNLPGSLEAYPIQRWADSLPDYDLFPEWISNYHYGNPQRNRNRMFMIGALRGLDFVFRPDERDVRPTVKDCIEDLPSDRDIPEINHVHVDPDARALDWRSLTGDRMTLRELAAAFLKVKPAQKLTYQNAQGQVKDKPGRYRLQWDGVAKVLTGGGNAGDPDAFHPLTGYPLTVRERARIQGYPDDFIFVGPQNLLVRQTGKFMPVQFCEYLSRQIAAHIQGQPFACSGRRVEQRRDSLIDDAKRKYCKGSGCSTEKRACQFCAVRRSCPMIGTALF